MPNTSEFTLETIQAYVLGTLDAETRELIEHTAEHDAELAAELAIWKSARQEQAMAAAQSAPGEFGWARIERAIENREAASAVNETASNDNSKGSARPIWLRQVIAPWQAAAGVAAAVLSWQVAVVPTITTASLDEEPAYELASGDTDSQLTLRIAFRETATEADLRAVLRDAGARIVDGPSAVGLYTISFADSAAKNAGAKVLSQRSDVVAEVAE